VTTINASELEWRFCRDGLSSARQVFMGMLVMKREKMRYNLP